jgi:hypothetical protein
VLEGTRLYDVVRTGQAHSGNLMKLTGTPTLGLPSRPESHRLYRRSVAKGTFGGVFEDSVCEGARQLGIEKTAAERIVKVASLTPGARETALKT